MANFEVFTRRMVPLVKQPAVTIQKRGNISINRAAFVALGEPQAVELLYDPTERIVGFRGVPVDTEHAYPMRPQGQKEDGPYIVAGMAFTKYYAIDTTISRRWPAAMQDDILCIDLKQPGTVVTSNRGRSAEREEGEAQGRLDIDV